MSLHPSKWAKLRRPRVRWPIATALIRPTSFLPMNNAWIVCKITCRSRFYSLVCFLKHSTLVCVDPRWWIWAAGPDDWSATAGLILLSPSVCSSVNLSGKPSTFPFWLFVNSNPFFENGALFLSFLPPQQLSHDTLLYNVVDNTKVQQLCIVAADAGLKKQPAAGCWDRNAARASEKNTGAGLCSRGGGGGGKRCRPQRGNWGAHRIRSTSKVLALVPGQNKRIILIEKKKGRLNGEKQGREKKRMGGALLSLCVCVSFLLSTNSPSPPPPNHRSSSCGFSLAPHSLSAGLMLAMMSPLCGSTANF